MDLLANPKSRLAKLDQAVADKDVRDYLLQLPKYWLDDVERKATPSMEIIMRPVIEEQLRHAEELLAKHGPNMRIVG